MVGHDERVGASDHFSGDEVGVPLGTGPDVRSPTRELAREVLIHGPIARSDLIRRLGLSAASLTRLSRPLLDDGFLIESDERARGGIGRPVRPLDVRVDAHWHVGVKLTGEHAFGVATDLRAAVLAEAVVELGDHSPERIVEAVAEIVAELTSAVGTVAPTALGVSIGGRVSGSRVVVRAPFLGWSDIDLGGLLATRLALPVVVANDVVALTEAEHWFGLGRGVDDFAVITIGAGVGYGLVVHGRQRITRDTGLGLGAHHPLDPTGPLCSDGHRGCSSAMLSIPSIRASVSEGSGRDVSYEDVLALAGAGDPAARTVTEQAGRALGRFIAAVANLTMVDTVVLAGEGIGLVPLVRTRIEEALAEDRDPDASVVELLIGASDFGIWARGAATMAIQSRIGRIG